MKSRRAANDRWVIREPAVAVQLNELIEEAFNEIKRVRAIRVTGKNDPLPSSEVFKRFFLKVKDFLFKCGDCLGD